jgi:hypothetical protein
MDQPSSTGPQQRWREEQPVQVPARPTASSWGGMKIFVLLALILALVGFMGGIISWLGSVPNPYFLPLWVTEYQARQIPALPMARQDLESLRSGQYFARVLCDALTHQEGHHMAQELANLKNLPADQALVVHVHAHAVREGQGEIYILPGDASPDNPRTWISLKEILERLRDCPAQQKLLVLDITHPLASPRLGVLFQDVASAIPAELAAVPDPQRLVLCPCSPGQTSLTSEELGRSVFSYYLEEALKGYAEAGYSERRPDGQIWVQEMVNFVRARVDRWAQHNRGTRQTPVLYGSGSDFPLTALDHGNPQPHQPEIRDLAYPKWLSEGWKLRDAWWREGTFRLAPRDFTQAQAILLEAEKSWRSGLGVSWIKENQLAFLEHCQAQMQRSRDQVQPVPSSLAQQAAQGKKSNEKLTKILQDWFALVPRQLALAKPEEINQIRAKLLEEIRDKTKDFGRFPLEQAVFQLALHDNKHEPGTLRLLDQIVQGPNQPSSPSVEIHLMGQLAELGAKMDSNAWPAELVGRVLEIAHKGEKAAGDPRVFAWIRPWLEEAAQLRHEAEVRLWTQGFAPLEDVDRLLKQSGQRYEAALQQADKVHQAQVLLEEALAVLPFYPSFLETTPGMHKTWKLAGQSARDLAERLRTVPSRENQDDPQEKLQFLFQLSDRIGDVQKSTNKLGELMRDLQKPFSAEQRDRLVKQGKQGQADGTLYSTMTSMLGGPHPHLTSEDRAALWTASHLLAKRLLDETLQMDQDDNQKIQRTALPDSWDEEIARLQEQARARDRAQAALAILELGGLPAAHLQPVRAAIEKAGRDPSPENWTQAGTLLRNFWSQKLILYYQQEENPSKRNQLTWIVPGLDSHLALDDVEMSAATQVRLQEVRQLWTWLGDFYRYRARDYQGLGVDSPGLNSTRQFFARVALANQDLVRLGPEAYVTMRTDSIQGLSPERPTTNVNLQVVRVLPENVPGPVDLTLIRPDFTWLNLAPDSAQLPALAENANGSRTHTSTVPVQVSLRSGAERTMAPQPEGFLAQARFNERTFHRTVRVPLQGLSQDFQILVSANPKEPEPSLQEIRLRPGKVRQPFFLHVKNLTTKNRKVLIEVVGSEGLVASASLVLGAMDAQPVRLEDKAPPPPPSKDKEADKTSLPELVGPLEIRLRDPDQPGPPLAVTKLRVGIASPREYVAVTDIRFDPPTAKTEGKNKLTVKLQALAPVPGPPIPADLVFPARRIPGFLGVEGGTFHGEIPNKDKLNPLLLFAEKISLSPGSDEEGPVYVNIDGVERSFIFQAFLGRSAEPGVPRGDGRPAVRVVADSFTQANPNFVVPIEADNAPTGATLEVSLGRLVGDIFEADAVRRFPEARQRSIGLAVQKGALVFEAAIRDWQATFDTTRVLGKRLLQVRMLDETGNEIQQSQQPILIDSNAPALIRFLDPPVKVKRGTTLALQAQGQDNESGVAQVVFFLGKPVEGKIPTNAPTFPGTPVDPQRSTWTAKVPLPPDGKGPTPVSVQFVNRVGLGTFDTTIIELMETDPDSTGPSRIKGKVVEGPRGQPGLEVILRDEKGMEKGRAKTQSDGSFLFDNLKPGRYSLFCRKPDTQRRASAMVTVSPNKTSSVTLNLSL